MRLRGAEVLGFVIVLEAAAFFFAALVHLGVSMFGVTEARVVPEAIVQALMGVFFAVSAYGVLKCKAWARITALVAHTVGLAGFLFGTGLTLLGQAEFELGHIYNLTRLVALITVSVILLLPASKSILRQEA
jgi:hypothetical protein